MLVTLSPLMKYLRTHRKKCRPGDTINAAKVTGNCFNVQLSLARKVNRPPEVLAKIAQVTNSNKTSQALYVVQIIIVPQFMAYHFATSATYSATMVVLLIHLITQPIPLLTRHELR
jgi:hypothetical protein